MSDARNPAGAAATFDERRADATPLAHAYDIDPYFAWARVAVDGSFDGPWERKYSVGTLFLRGAGRGTGTSHGSSTNRRGRTTRCRAFDTFEKE